MQGIKSYIDYHPFGSLMNDRNFTGSNSYRYGFNGQEKDDEVKGSGNCVNFEFRMYDPRVGKFFSPDPIGGTFPMLSTYQFASNTPLQAIDYEGLEGFIITRTGYNIGQGKTTVVTDQKLKWGTYTIIWQLLSDRDKSIVFEERTERNKPFTKNAKRDPAGLVSVPMIGVVFSTTAKGIQNFESIKNLIKTTVEASKNEQLAASAPVGSKTTSERTYTEQQTAVGEVFTKEITEKTTTEVTGYTVDIEVSIQAVNIGSDYVKKLGSELTKMGYKISYEVVNEDALKGAATLNIEDKANPVGVNINFSVGVVEKTKKTTTSTLNKVTHDASGQTITNPNN